MCHPASQPPNNAAVPRRAPWHRQTKELRLQENVPTYKEGPELWRESRYKKREAKEPRANGQQRG